MVGAGGAIAEGRLARGLNPRLPARPDRPRQLEQRGGGNRSVNRQNSLQRTSARERPTDPTRAPSPVDSRNPIRPKPHDSA
jgi:hypothetical protein